MGLLKMTCSNKILSDAKEVFEIEAQQLLNVANMLDCTGQAISDTSHL